MKLKPLFWLFLLSLSAISRFAMGQISVEPTPALPPPTNATLAERKTIDRACAAIDLEVKNKSLKIKIYADLSNGMGDSPITWKVFKDEAELEKACGEGCFTLANLYFKAGKPVLASMDFSSPSGDWITYVNYYFRADGKVMKNHSDLRRFGAEDPAVLAQEDKGGLAEPFLVEVLRDLYYDGKGTLILAPSAKYINMDTKKVVSKPDYMEGEWPLYLSLPELPFYSLISKISEK